MKKIFTSTLILSLYLSLGIVENYSFGHSLLYPKFLTKEKFSSKNHLIDLVNKRSKDNFETEPNYLIQEQPEFLEEKVNDTDVIHLNYTSEYLITYNNIDDEINESSFLPGENVTLVAEPNPGFDFINWTIDGTEVSKNLIYVFTMPSKNVSIQANFKKESVLAPTIDITGPAANSQFIQGDNISITANAADSDGTISKVEFFNGSNLLGTDTSSPYSFSWGNLPTGNFTLAAKATDNQGAATVSAGVNINVVEKGNLAPTVSITEPTANAQFNRGDSISITANASDSDGTIAKVEFFNGTTLLGTDTTSPYSFSWANAPAGSLTLTAMATDNKGTSISSAGKTIKVIENTNRAPFGGMPASIPGTVEAENYDDGGNGVTYQDFDAGNNGNVYRTDDVDIEAASEGGYNIGWMNNGEWLEYSVNISTAGTYTLDARVAAPDSGGTFHIECNGVDVTGPLKVPATGGWDTWTSVMKTGVNLPAGSHILRFVIDTKGVNGYLGNLNSMTFTNPSGAPTVSITEPTASTQFIQGENITITANASALDGTITKLEFFNGTTFLGTDATEPYSFDWTNLPVGNFALTAKATDNKGISSVSTVVNIKVVEKTIVPPGPIAGAGLLEGLVAFYEMNTNNSGVLYDSHGQNHGFSKLINHVDGYDEKGNLYNGLSSISSVPHNDGLNLSSEFTIMADVFRQGNGQSNKSIIVGKTFSSTWPENQAYSIAVTKDNKIRIRTNNTGLKDWVSNKTVPLEKWVRIIATYKSGEGYSLYLDTTEPENSSQISGNIAKSDQELTIGSASLLRNAANTRRFEGILDNVGIWNRKLSREEIKALITSKITYPEFTGNEVYKITMMSTSNGLPGKKIISQSTKAEAGDKLIFLVDEEEDLVFDHWSIEGDSIGNQSLVELQMPKKDITLTQHFRTFVTPEIKINLQEGKSEFNALSSVHINLETKSNDAQIEKIELLNGDDIIGEFPQEGEGFVWKNIPAGSHHLKARITDTNGNFYFSDSVILKAIDDQPKDISNRRLDYVLGPNPTTEQLNVIFTNLDGIYNLEIKVISMNGMVQKTFTHSSEESLVTIDVSYLNDGVYILQLSANGYYISSRKFIKK